MRSSKISKKQGLERGKGTKKGNLFKVPDNFPEEDGLLDALYVHSIDAFTAFHLFELYAIVLTYFLEESAVMYKNILLGFV